MKYFVLLVVVGCASESEPTTQRNRILSADGFTYVVDTIGAAQCVHYYRSPDRPSCVPLR